MNSRSSRYSTVGVGRVKVSIGHTVIIVTDLSVKKEHHTIAGFATVPLYVHNLDTIFPLFIGPFRTPNGMSGLPVAFELNA